MNAPAKQGSVLVGRIVVEENEKAFLMPNPFAPLAYLVSGGNEGDKVFKK